MLFELVHEFVPFSLEGHHLLLGFLLVGGRQLQKSDISIFFTNGRQQSLLFHFQDLLKLFPTLLSHVGEVCVSLL